MCAENLTPSIVVMRSTQDWTCSYEPRPAGPGLRFARLCLVRGAFEHDHSNRRRLAGFCADAPHQVRSNGRGIHAGSIRSVARHIHSAKRRWCNGVVPDAHRAQLPSYGCAVNAILIADRRCAGNSISLRLIWPFVRECLAHPWPISRAADRTSVCITSTVLPRRPNSPRSRIFARFIEATIQEEFDVILSDEHMTSRGKAQINDLIASALAQRGSKKASA